MSKKLIFISMLIVLSAADQSPTANIPNNLSSQVDRRNNLSFKRVKDRQTINNISSQKYTGIAKRIDDISRQITVRIEDESGGNGSGVIIAKGGNTYYLVTAAHVVKEQQKYWIITPTKERVSIATAQIQNANPELDIAIVKFQSQQNYRIANIGNYRFRKLDFIFIAGFPGRDKSKQRYITAGAIFTDEKAEFYAKDRNSFDRGQNLVYTNLSLPGMSGGAVLDRQGRLIGINTSAENEAIITPDGQSTADINFGFSLGIPISTIIELADRGQLLPRSQLQVSTTPIPAMTQPEGKEIGRVFFSTVAKPSKNAAVKDWLDYGNLLWRNLRSSSPEEAVDAFKTAIELLERHPEALYYQEQLRTAYFGMGVAYSLFSRENSTDYSVTVRQAGAKVRSQAAIVAFHKAIAVDPGFYQSWRYLGFELQSLRRYEEALTAYQQAIAQNKNNFVLYVEQGDIFRALGRYQAAIDSYNLAMQLKPTHPWIYNNRGNTFAKWNRYPEAIADFSRAIEINPRLVIAHYNRGLTYSLQEKFDLSIADLNRAIELDPQRAASYSGRGMFYAVQKKFDRATSDCNKALELDPELPDGYVCRGLTYQYQQQCPLAIKNYDRAVELDITKKMKISCPGS
jgi:tetratricopeptide (TPR) repeat protein/S1-C subfamily serine protease